MTTYSIHLDDLDVALLPIGRCSNNFLKKELFEFQLLAKEAEDQPVYTNHKCHICAVDVPAAFWSAHCLGIKHRANARIATAAAQRMSALITATPPPHIPHVTEKFCDSCTCIAGKDHEKSQEHKLSVFQDKMLCDLVMIYTGDDVHNEQKENEKQIKKKLKDATYREYYINVDEDIAKADFGVVNGDQSPIVENGTDMPNQNKIENIDSKICSNNRVTPRCIESFVINNEVVQVNVKKEKTHTNVNHQDTASTSLEEHKLSVSQDRNLCDLVTINTSDDVNNVQKPKKKKKKKKDSKDAMEQEHSQKVNENNEIADHDLVKVNADQAPKVKNASNIQNQNKVQNISGDKCDAKPTMPSYAEVMTNKNEKSKTNSTATKVNPQDVSEQNNGLDAKDYPLLEENEIHYPFVKELTEVRCIVCDCITPSDLQNRVLHVMGRRHVAKLSILHENLNSLESKIETYISCSRVAEEYFEQFS